MRKKLLPLILMVALGCKYEPYVQEDDTTHYYEVTQNGVTYSCRAKIEHYPGTDFILTNGPFSEKHVTFYGSYNVIEVYAYRGVTCDSLN